MLLNESRTALLIVALLTIMTGLAYPVAITAMSQLLFPQAANGSLVTNHGSVLGSDLIGQPFHDPKYFWSRPSATSPFEYNAASSSGSNDGPLNPAFLDAVRKRVHDLAAVDPGETMRVPVDLVTASGSGLDPHISVAAARYQVRRVARVRHLDPDRVEALVEESTEGRQWGFIGEPRVNVLRLNLALDHIAAKREDR